MMGIDLVRATRQNHALEHATIHLLNRRHPMLRSAGLSTPYGFFVYGHVPTQDVQHAVMEALARLQNGERHLAVYPQCGTNLVTAGTLVGLVTFLTMLPGDGRSRRERLPLVLLLSTLTLLLVQPLGPIVQEYVTTTVDHASTQVTRIERNITGKVPIHKVYVEHGLRA